MCEHKSVKLSALNEKSSCDDFAQRRIPLIRILEETFNTICFWNPVAQGIDHVRLVKFVKKMSLLSSVKNSAH